MADRHLPPRPDLEQLRRRAKELLRGLRASRPEAITLLRQHHPQPPAPADARLADAQLTLARSHGLASWPRLVLACRLVEAIRRDDVDEVRRLVTEHPRLLHERALGEDSNWGPPMAHAANLGRERIVALLAELGAEDLQWAFDRACLRGDRAVARRLYSLGARPTRDSIMGPAETQCGAGMEYLLSVGAEISDADGNRLAPVALVLETYCRNPRGKHRCLELLAARGIDLPDTPPMAVHRGNVELLQRHLERNPGLFDRTFGHREIWPPELGCHDDESLAQHGTPLAGGTLLHLCVDNDEIELAAWMLARGADPDGRAAVDDEGFGGHTALFGCVVSQPWRVGLRRDDGFARLLLEHGADPGTRASLRKRLRFVRDESLHEYRDVTPLSWGERFHDQSWVNRPAMQRTAAAGGEL